MVPLCSSVSPQSAALIFFNKKCHGAPLLFCVPSVCCIKKKLHHADTCRVDGEKELTIKNIYLFSVNTGHLNYRERSEAFSSCPAVINYTPVMRFVCGGRGVGVCMLESLVLVSTDAG